MTDVGMERTQGRTIWVWVALRFVIAWMLIWAFFDKLLGLGYATKPGRAWIDGFSPTSGFLDFGTSGIFEDLFKGLANNVAVDFLFMAALILIGVALLLGVGQKITAVAGVLMFGLMWLANFPPANNPIVDDHVIDMLAMVGIGLSRAGDHIGLGRRWREVDIVKNHPILE